MSQVLKISKIKKNNIMFLAIWKNKSQIEARVIFWSLFVHAFLTSGCCETDKIKLGSCFKNIFPEKYMQFSKKFVVFAYPYDPIDNKFANFFVYLWQMPGGVLFRSSI